ncbi:MAG: M56 family metallopeptidase [Bacteroides sp.]
MGAFLFYLIKSSLCLIVFYLLFRLTLRQTTFFRFNRLTLLVGMSCCLLLPLIELTKSETSFLPLHTLQEILDGSAKTVVFSVSTDGIGETLPGSRTDVSGSYWLLRALGVGYLLGSCVMLLCFLVSTYRMCQLVRGAEKKRWGNYRLLVVRPPIGAFSWGRYIVISQSDYERHVEEILLHESMHIRNHHTIDLLFIHLYFIIYWFNPAVWLLKRELQEIHEYEADNGVLHTGIDATRYQLLLVEKAVGTRLYSMANGFNHSKLKKRINMMLKERTKSWARLKLLLFAPAVAVTLYAFARPEVKEVLQPTIPQMQQSVGDDYVSLMSFFKKEEEAYKDRTYGKQDIDLKVKEKQVHKLLMNNRNQILFENVYVKTEQLKPLVMKNLLTSWEASGRKDTQIIVLQYDRGSDSGALAEMLKEVKNAYEQIRSDLSAGSADKSQAYLNKLFPIRLWEDLPENYNQTVLSKEERINDIVATLYPSGKMETIENFTLNELQQKVIAARNQMPDPENLVVGIKVAKNCKMGTVTDVKDVLRKISALKVNIEKE